jgi:hypothetical protein
VIVEKRGERDLAEIRGVISAPTLRPDGTILSTPGYDPATKLLLRGDAFGTVHECPSRAQLEEAFRTLWKPFAEFPFVAAQDRGVALAAILTALVRRTLGKCPGFSFDAPAAGTGKTLLGQCILRLAGCLPEVVPQCEEEEEIKKQLLSVLREGVGGILFDNIRGVYGSAALEAFLTGEIYKDRVLGLSAMFAGEPNILVLFSGNNFLPKGDLWRRILTARMDAKCADPERRAFDLKPLEYVRQHRQELVAAGLTLMRGFIVESRPRFTPDSLGSFEGWDDLIRQCVIWLGQQGIADVADPALVIATAKEREPERQKLKALLSGAYLLFDTSKWRVGELIKTAEGRQDDELLETLQEIAGERGKVNPRILGRWIERNSDVRCGNMRLVRCDQKSTSGHHFQSSVTA